MKHRIVDRGLFTDEIFELESDEDFRNFPQEERVDYIDAVERAARAILNNAGIDPDALFESIEIREGDVLRRGSRLALQYDREKLSTKVHDAIEVLSTVRLVRARLKEHPEERAAVGIGILLANRVSRAEANLAWDKPVRGYIKITRNLLHESKLRKPVLAEKAKLEREGVKPHKLASTICGNLSLRGIDCTDKQVRNILNPPKKRNSRR